MNIFAHPMTVEIIQSYLNLEVGLGMNLGTVIILCLASAGLPVLHPGVREKIGLQKPKQNKPQDNA